jgi:hypothetical protein
MLSVIRLIFVILSVIRLSVIRLNVIRLSVIMLIVVMLNVVAPSMLVCFLIFLRPKTNNLSFLSLPKSSLPFFHPSIIAATLFASLRMLRGV